MHIYNVLSPAVNLLKDRYATKDTAWQIFTWAVIPYALYLATGKAKYPMLVTLGHVAERKFKRFIAKHLLLPAQAELLGKYTSNTEVITSDGVTLRGLTIKNNKSHKWILFFCPNGVGVDGLAEEYKGNSYFSNLMEGTNANLIAINFRGVGVSYGETLSFEDTEKDAEAVLQYLLIQDVKKEDILVYGPSYGGAAALSLVKNHPTLNIVSDRSLCSFQGVVTGWRRLITAYYWKKSVLHYSLAMVLLYPLEILFRVILFCEGWNFDGGALIQKHQGKALIIHHENDNMIVKDGGSLRSSILELKESHSELSLAQLNRPEDAGFVYEHCRGFSRNEKSRVNQFINACFSKQEEKKG